MPPDCAKGTIQLCFMCQQEILTCLGILRKKKALVVNSVLLLHWQNLVTLRQHHCQNRTA